MAIGKAKFEIAHGPGLWQGNSHMKTLLVASIIAAFSLVASVQADDKPKAATTKSASVTTSAEQAKSSCAEKSGCCAEKTSCCAEKPARKADVSVKGATLLVRR